MATSDSVAAPEPRLPPAHLTEKAPARGTTLVVASALALWAVVGSLLIWGIVQTGIKAAALFG